MIRKLQGVRFKADSQFGSKSRNASSPEEEQGGEDAPPEAEEPEEDVCLQDVRIVMLPRGACLSLPLLLSLASSCCLPRPAPSPR